MVEKMWPALKSCKRQCHKAKDRLSQLPDDILLLIVSYLTLKEAAQASVLSHRWNYIWRCLPVLKFEDNSTMQRFSDVSEHKFIPRERKKISRLVNRVINAHVGHSIDEFGVTFDLDKRYESAMNKWVMFALAKQVKRLELDLRPPFLGMRRDFSLPRWPRSLDEPHNLGVFKTCLRSLCLKFVNVTTESVECLLLSCLVLENLCIVYSPSIEHVRAIGSPLQLKHLEICYCHSLRSVDILAPKLLSFTHYGRPPDQLHIRNAYLLSEVSVGSRVHTDSIAYAFNALSTYFSQLEYLRWHVTLYVGGIVDYTKLNSGISNPPAMTNLKHLELHVDALSHQSLLGWVDFIEACPLLQKLTVKFIGYEGFPTGKIKKHRGRPLKSLETLDFLGNLGLPVDLEFVTYVIKNAIMLKDFIVKFRPAVSLLAKFVSARDHDKKLAKLKKILPKGVNLTLKPMEKTWDSCH